MNNETFEFKLTNGLYKTAYDPIAKRFVSIKRIKVQPSGRIMVFARRLNDPAVHEYASTELIDYTI